MEPTLRARVRAGDPDAFGALLGIALNVTRNVTRAARRHQAAMSRLPVPPPEPDFAEGLASQLDDAAELRRVLAALDGLRPGEREVIVLCVWSGLDYAAAAEALGVPVGTVRSRMFRARDKLRRAAPSEPALGRGQIEGDREPAVRSMREVTR